jgi:hypothetical protein
MTGKEFYAGGMVWRLERNEFLPSDPDYDIFHNLEPVMITSGDRH